jgi:hypothetical protein
MKYNIILVTAALVVLFAACKKEQTSPEEQAMGAFLADSTTRVVRGNYNKFEIGYRFYASRRGRITKLGTRLPEPGIYSVSLWDFDTQVLLVQQKVVQTAAGVLKLENIPPVAVQSNRKYVVSVYYDATPKAAYVITNQDYTSGMLPFTKGSLTVVNAQFRNADQSMFPNTINNVGIFGYPEVVFVAD